jgi:quinoprotein dehydrogenase-associated probable ABC transporter substrate-binding protein
MSSRCLKRKRGIELCLIFAFATRLIAQDDCCARKEEPHSAGAPANKRILRVTSDPNNLPFSNDRCEGFENKIAELIAHELDATLEYSWRAQRRGFFRETLKENRCDLVLGVPAHFDMALTTAPYYRSTYVFVYRNNEGLDLRSLDDPKLRKLKIGVQMIGDDGRNTPPAHALADRGIVENVAGYTLYGDYTQENPPARIIDAVLKGDIDVAVVWGPLGGYFTKQRRLPLCVVPVEPAADPHLPFTFAIAMGVRKSDQALRGEIDAILERKRDQIDAILNDYGVPRVPNPGKEVALAK